MRTGQGKIPIFVHLLSVLEPLYGSPTIRLFASSGGRVYTNHVRIIDFYGNNLICLEQSRIEVFNSIDHTDDICWISFGPYMNSQSKSNNVFWSIPSLPIIFVFEPEKGEKSQKSQLRQYHLVPLILQLILTSLLLYDLYSIHLSILQWIYSQNTDILGLQQTPPEKSLLLVSQVYTHFPFFLHVPCSTPSIFVKNETLKQFLSKTHSKNVQWSQRAWFS